MSSLKIVGLEDVVAQLPNVRELDRNEGARLPSATIFLCALGFEPRCLMVARMLAEQQFKARRVYYFEYATNRADNDTNRTQLLQYLSKISSNVEPLAVDDATLFMRLRQVFEGIVGTEQLPTIVFDISVASSRLLLRSMKAILEADVSLSVLYAEAAAYHPTEQEYRAEPAKWSAEDSLGLQRGISEVTVEYSGYHIDQLPDCLLLFPGFRRERSLAVISYVDPLLLAVPQEKVIWLIGVPRLSQDRWRVAAMKEINGLTEEVPTYEVSTFDYRESLRVLQESYQQRVTSYRITLSPMGSKLQGLGAVLFCYMHPDVRVVCATPQEYNAALYSEGCKATWIIEFGDVRKVKATLDKVGMVQIKS